MDREKVIKWLNVCKTSHYAVGIKEDYPCRLCPYYEKEYCMKELISDALELLKEQEAVELYSMNAERTYGICPKCGKIVFRYGNVEENHYCGVCGQAVKWE